jgi:hypothetical protein
VKQNVIDPLIGGKNHGPRQAVETLKTIIPPSLPSAEMGEDRQEFSRIVTDMSGQTMDSSIMQTFGGPTAIGMEQVQYQSGDLLGFSGDPGYEQYRVFDSEINQDQDTIDAMNHLERNGMDFSVGFEPFDQETYWVNPTEAYIGQ